MLWPSGLTTNSAPGQQISLTVPSGGFRDRHWGDQGRVYTDALPFFQRTLMFTSAN
jgi:hypothetical protein